MNWAIIIIETHDRIPTRFFSGKVLVKKGFAVILSSVLLALKIWTRHITRNAIT